MILTFLDSAPGGATYLRTGNTNESKYLNGRLDVAGDFTASNAGLRGNLGVQKVEAIDSISGKILSIKKDAVIGPAYIGPLQGTWAQFSNAKSNGQQGYALAQGPNGRTWLNSPSEVTIALKDVSDDTWD